MCQIILDKLFVKFQQFLKMEHLKLPSYLNTLEKSNEMIRATDTVKKYEEVFYKLLGDESLPLLDILTLMRCIERDVILVHGSNDVTHLLELTESFIRYMISMSEESYKNLQNQILREIKNIMNSTVLKMIKIEHCTYITRRC